MDDGTYGVVVLECTAHPRSVQQRLQHRRDVPVHARRQPASGHHQQAGHRQRVHGHHEHRAPPVARVQRDPPLLPPGVRGHGRRLQPERSPCPGEPGDRAAAVRQELRPTARRSRSSTSGSRPRPRPPRRCTSGRRSSAPASHRFTVDVTNTSSNSARENFFSKLVDIGVTSVPPTLDERKLAAPTTSSFSVTPLDLTAVVVRVQHHRSGHEQAHHGSHPHAPTRGAAAQRLRHAVVLQRSGVQGAQPAPSLADPVGRSGPARREERRHLARDQLGQRGSRRHARS